MKRLVGSLLMIGVGALCVVPDVTQVPTTVTEQAPAT
jgi:hypothetical protein